MSSDYREFLELAYTFLGGIPPRGIKFRTPGAMHHARWLSKAIYCLKMFMFQEQFKLRKQEFNGLRQICIFLVVIYLKAWFIAPCSIKSPQQDLEFMQDLVEYKTINAEISKAGSVKFSGHLWYLSEKLAALSLFDKQVPIEIKTKMVHYSMKHRESTTLNAKRVSVKNTNLDSFTFKDISDFITKRSTTIFHQFGLSTTFLDINPDQWETNESYNNCLSVLQKMKVVNDIAERGVALIEQFNDSLTKNEDQKQYILQVVQMHRKRFPNSNKNNYSTATSK